MKILILGGDGMLGHQLLQHFQVEHEVCATLRQDKSSYEKYGLFNTNNSYFGIDVRSTDRLIEIIADFQPEAVINAVGIVKQRSTAKDSIPSLEVNALLPHRLAVICKAAKARLVHMSTDCVFSGDKGSYTEQDNSDARDLYGRSKYLGEVVDSNCITLRTSIIGLELSRKKSLIEWCLAQTGTIKGFKKAIYTGLTTIEMGRVIELVLTKFPNLSGVWHVASQPISKYDLLLKFTEKLQRDDLNLIEDIDFICDRSMLSPTFHEQTGYIAPSWDMMLDELVEQIRHRKV